MNELATIALGAAVGVLSGLMLGVCFICLLGCEQLEMQIITLTHSTMAMIVMCAWAVPALLSRESDP